jgi:uncharacterized protein DUF5655
MAGTVSIKRQFQNREPGTKAAYDALLAALREFGPVKEAPKQTSIHLEKNSGFAGVHPRQKHLNLEFRTNYAIDDPRISRTQQLSANRFEHMVKLDNPAQVDAQLLGWLKDAYELSQ